MTALNPNTIARAYQEMERLGLIETRRGRGTFVAVAPPFDLDEAKKTISGLVEKILIEAANARIGKERLLSLITEMVEKWFAQKGESRNGAGD